MLTAALKKNPKDTDALLQRAELRSQAGDYPKAELDLNEVLHPGFLRSSLLAGSSPSRPRRRSELPAGIDRSAARAAAGDQRPLGTGADAAGFQRSEGAIRVLDEAPDSQKKSVALLAQRNWALLSQGDMAQLRKGIDAGLAEQKSPEFLSQDGYWKVRNGDYKGAVAAFNAAAKPKGTGSQGSPRPAR